MSWETLIKSTSAQRFVIAIAGFIVAFFVWKELTHQINKNAEIQAAHIASLGVHIASQGRELEEMRKGLEFMRNYIEEDQDQRKEDQSQRREFFVVIQEHLKSLLKN